MKTPKEDPKDRAARLRERRMSEIDQTAAVKKNAAGLTSELQAIYGFSSANFPGVVPAMSKVSAPSVFGRKIAAQ